jgi:hypothetical protein
LDQKKRRNIYISDEVANVLKAYYQEKTGQEPNLSGACTVLAQEIKKNKKLH